MRTTRGIALTFGGVLIALLTGCGGGAPGMDRPSVAAVVDAQRGSPAQAAPPGASLGASVAPIPPSAPAHVESAMRVSTGAAAASSSAPPNGKEGAKHASNPAVLIMYTGSVAMMVDEGAVASSIDKMVDVAEASGGHLAGRTDGTVTLKVPSANFRAVLSEIERLGTVTNRSVSAEDVTEEYKDAEVRLANLRATRTRIQEFLAKAANISDMLTLEQQLERVTLEIDRTEGRMRFLRERTSFSTITIHVAPRPVAIVVKDPPPPPPPPPQPIVAIELPATWLEQLGADRLQQVKR